MSAGPERFLFGGCGEGALNVAGGQLACDRKAFCPKSLKVLLFERGDLPGAKNMFGGMPPNCPVIEELLPDVCVLRLHFDK